MAFYDTSQKKNNLGQKSISSMGSSIWNKLSNHPRVSSTATLFTHYHKKLVLKSLNEQNIN